MWLVVYPFSTPQAAPHCNTQSMQHMSDIVNNRGLGGTVQPITVGPATGTVQPGSTSAVSSTTTLLPPHLSSTTTTTEAPITTQAPNHNRGCSAVSFVMSPADYTNFIVSIVFCVISVISCIYLGWKYWERKQLLAELPTPLPTNMLKKLEVNRTLDVSSSPSRTNMEVGAETHSYGTVEVAVNADCEASGQSYTVENLLNCIKSAIDLFVQRTVDRVQPRHGDSSRGAGMTHTNTLRSDLSSQQGVTAASAHNRGGGDGCVLMVESNPSTPVTGGTINHSRNDTPLSVHMSRSIAFATPTGDGVLSPEVVKGVRQLAFNNHARTNDIERFINILYCMNHGTRAQYHNERELPEGQIPEGHDLKRATDIQLAKIIIESCGFLEKQEKTSNNFFGCSTNTQKKFAYVMSFINNYLAKLYPRIAHQDDIELYGENCKPHHFMMGRFYAMMNDSMQGTPQRHYDSSSQTSFQASVVRGGWSVLSPVKTSASASQL